MGIVDVVNLIEELARIVDAGGLRPLVDEELFDLETVGAAYAKLSSGKARGKVVIEI